MKSVALTELCQNARRNGSKLLSVYLTAGYPDRKWTLALVQSLFDAGADFVELGVPFSDPLADGPTIQNAGAAALRGGTRLYDVFEFARETACIGPVLLMGYFNSVAVYGRERFLEHARHNSVSGLILPDLPPDEEPEFHNQARAFRLPVIPFIAPTTTEVRITRMDELGAPLIYAVSLTGVTGTRKSLTSEAIAYLRHVRSLCKTPLLAGFGIGSGELARSVVPFTDGIIVGSAIIERIANSTTCQAACASVQELTRELRMAIDQEVNAPCS